MASRPRHSRTVTMLPTVSDLPIIKGLNQDHSSRLVNISVDSTESIETKTPKGSTTTPKASTTKLSTFHALALSPKNAITKSHCVSIERSVLPVQHSSRSMLTLPSLTRNNTVKALRTLGNTPMESELRSTQTRYRFLPGFRRTVEETKEENDVRTGLISNELLELKSMPVIDREMRELYNSSYIFKDTEKALRLAESVLSTLGIQVRSFMGNISDSGMTIYPVTEKFKLAYFYKLFIPELSRFNFTFLAKIRLNTITVCESLELTNKKYAAALDQKLHSGLFVLEKMVDQKTVQQQLFKVVLYHFLRMISEFYGDWQDKMLETGKKPGKVRPFEELLITFNYILGIDKEQHEKNKGIDIRAKFLKEALTKLDLFPEENEGDD